MWPIFLLLLVVVVVVLGVKYKVYIDFITFIKKGFRARRGKFGVYCFCGKQGSGKTFSVVNYLLKNQNLPIYSNVTLVGIKYTKIKNFQDMLAIDDHHCIIVFDEIFSALTKTSRIDENVLSFLSQQRKREIIFITTAQEWLEIPITLRRYVRFQIDCSIFNILPFSILIERYRDGELMKWDNIENDYIAPIISTKISKMMMSVTKHYDTFEVIKTSSAPAPLRVGGEGAYPSRPMRL